jgi:hypothetical protein
MSDQMTQAGSGPQPGWYQDPSGPGYRWWDGTQWTDQTHPGTQQQQAAASAPAPTPAAPAAPAATTPAASKPGKPSKNKDSVSGASNWLNENPLPVVLVLAVVLAIVVVLFVI